MRELKFRAWDKVQGKYIEVVRMQFSLARTPILITQELSDRQLLTDPASMYDIEQYTGLKDKNGKEIYDGDIVEYAYTRCNYKVVYRRYDASFVLENDDREEIIHLHYDRQDSYEVIGNVHEDHELLEEE